jgi:caffeoyl-CoA O-methyltransferase
MELVHHLAEAYAKQFTSAMDEVRSKNEAETLAQHPHSIMHSGALQGQLLTALSLMIRPSNILEIGTFTGFSALCLAGGLQPGGMLHTIEIREEDANKAYRYFKEAGMQDRIKLHLGDAREIIPTLSASWDIVFIDADKHSYIDYYELTLPTIRKGGWIIADNVLFHGQVLETPVKGKNALSIDAFNRHVSNDPRTEQVMLTVRDGLMLIRKL